MKYKRLEWDCVEPFFLTFVKCCSVFSLNLIVADISQVKNYTYTLKLRNINVIITTEQYFSQLPEKYRYPSICSP